MNWKDVKPEIMTMQQEWFNELFWFRFQLRFRSRKREEIRRLLRDFEKYHQLEKPRRSLYHLSDSYYCKEGLLWHDDQRRGMDGTYWCFVFTVHIPDISMVSNLTHCNKNHKENKLKQIHSYKSSHLFGFTDTLNLKVDLFCLYKIKSSFNLETIGVHKWTWFNNFMVFFINESFF